MCIRDRIFEGAYLCTVDHAVQDLVYDFELLLDIAGSDLFNDCLLYTSYLSDSERCGRCVLYPAAKYLEFCLIRGFIFGSSNNFVAALCYTCLLYTSRCV